MSSKDLTLCDVKDISIELLKEFHYFCVQNNLRYTLFGGTMIGAIRHKGFIPWDDDIDVAMPRPDYDRFILLYKSSEQYALLANELGNSCLAFARLCDNKRTMVDCHSYYWTSEDIGVWIDIFPLDAIPDSDGEIDKVISKCTMYWSLSNKYRFSFCEENRILYKIAKYVLWRLPYILIGGSKSYCRYCKRIKWGTTNHIANLSYMHYGKKECAIYDDFQNYALYSFENLSFYCITGYDRYMRSKYGDYMKLPPVCVQNKRQHAFKYTWK